jgi:hypothetical protein
LSLQKAAQYGLLVDVSTYQASMGQYAAKNTKTRYLFYHENLLLNDKTEVINNLSFLVKKTRFCGNYIYVHVRQTPNNSPGSLNYLWPFDRSYQNPVLSVILFRRHETFLLRSYFLWFKLNNICDMRCTGKLKVC